MKICGNCTLNDLISSVRVNDEGLCNYCQDKQENHARQESADDAEQQLQAAFDRHKDAPYQVLLAYSGGKDSTYTLCSLREKFGVSVLAVTFDNGFLTEQCRQNIHKATAALGVDSLTLKPAFSKLAGIFQLAAKTEIFPPKAIERASSICTACIGLIKLAVYREAILRQIPFVCFGWTPGQVRIKNPVLRLDYRMILSNQKQLMDPVLRHLGEGYRDYFLDAAWLEARKESIPALAYPLAFGSYSEAEILETIGRVGWERPRDTDMNSTNCLLNSYANDVHIRAYGYNPYCLEIAGLVREGHMSREEGLRKLAGSGDEDVIQYVRRELEAYSRLRPLGSRT